MTYRFGIFDFEVESGQLRKNARPLSLERQPARVLAVLLARAGELVSREALRESVWGRETHVDFDRGLAYCLSQIRAALGDRSDNPRFVQTFPKRGYKFIAPVTVESIPSTEGHSPERPAPTRVPRLYVFAAVSVSLLLVAAWFFVNRRADAVLVAVSIFDNETGVAEYDRPIAGLSDLVVTNLANLAPGRLAVIDAPPEVVGFYRKLWCVNPSEAPSVNLRGRPAHALDSLLKATSATAVFYGQTSQALPENIARIQSRFPFMLERHDRVEGQTFVFAARPHGEAVKDIRAQVLRTPEVLTGEGWDVDPKILLVVDTVSSNYMPRKVWDFTGHEYGAVYDQPIYKLVGGPNDLIEVSTTIERADAACDLGLVVELKDGDRSLFYRSNQLTGALRDADGRVTLITTVKLSDIPRHGDGSRLRTYLYNPARRAAMISALRVQVREGDPVLYGLYEPIVGHWTYR